MQKHSILSLTLIAAVMLGSTGCGNRNASVEMEELRADNERLTSEITALSKENLLLAEQRNKALEENQRLNAHLRGMEGQLRDIGSVSGSLGPQFSATGDGGVALNQDLAFKKGSADLNNDAIGSIRKLAKMLNDGEYADTFVIVEGHTDTTPVVRAETKKRFGDNWGLSAMRAAAVVRVLKEAGVKAERIRGAFRGEFDPTGDSDKSKDRRVEIYLQLPQ